MHDLLIAALDVVNVAVLVYFVLLNGGYLFTSVIAHRAMHFYARRLKTLHVDALVDSASAPPITLVATAYNEEATCVESVQSLLTLQYHDYQVLLVNDGSTDQTLARMTEAYDLEPVTRTAMASLPTKPVRGVFRSRRFPNLWVVDKENGGKADAMNAGLCYCRTPLFAALDADGLLERDALIRVVRPFLEDRRTIATGGTIRIINGCSVENGAITDVRLPSSFLARLQVLEYLRAFLAGRVGRNFIRATILISGAFGVFRRDLVVDAGGYAAGSLGEDLELILKLHRHCTAHGIPYRIDYVPDPVAWTQCPEDYGSLSRQRRRWQRGLTETLLKYRGMVLRRRYGAVGLLTLPFVFFLEMLGPVIEFLGYVGFVVALLIGHLSASHALAFFLVAFALGGVLSLAAIALEEQVFHRYERTVDLAWLFGLSFVEVFGYRQINSWWRIRGLWASARGSKEGWGAMKRQAFQARAA